MSDSNRSDLFEFASVPDNYRQYLLPTVFAPWASQLIDYVGLQAGQTVLDVASGTGAVARAAATVVGAGGRVIASDISAGMLAHVNTGIDPDGAPIQMLECSAMELALPDRSMDVVLCQHGLPFIPDRIQATREMRRVLRTGGTVGIAVWLSETRLEPFDSFGEALEAEGIDEPFPRAWDPNSFKMSVQGVEQLLVDGGFDAISVITRDLELHWPSLEAAALGITGTPYGPVLARLGPEQQHRVMDALRERLTADDGSARTHVVTAVLAKATAP